MTRTLYLTRNGLLEPLGQSQVMSYLRGLSREYEITLVTFEKPEDRADAGAMARARADCAAHGIDWQPKPFRRRPRILAPAWSLLTMTASALRLTRSKDVGLIHARSYLPAGVAWIVWRRTGTPFIFDMRARFNATIKSSHWALTGNNLLQQPLPSHKSSHRLGGESRNGSHRQTQPA